MTSLCGALWMACSRERTLPDDLRGLPRARGGDLGGDGAYASGLRMGLGLNRLQQRQKPTQIAAVVRAHMAPTT